MEMQRIRSGLYRTEQHRHKIEVERIDTSSGMPDVGWWTFRIDNGWNEEPWPTRKQALTCATASVDEMDSWQRPARP